MSYMRFLIAFTALSLMGVACARSRPSALPASAPASTSFAQPEIAVPDGWVRYTSPLGVSFIYPKTFDRGQGIENVIVQVAGNTIKMFPEKDQNFDHRITVLRKLANEEVQKWMARELLKGATPESHCRIERSNNLRHSNNPPSQSEDYEVVSDLGLDAVCGNYYLGGAVGGLRYNPAVPDKVLFIAIGQDSFLGEDYQKFLDSVEPR